MAHIYNIMTMNFKWSGNENFWTSELSSEFIIWKCAKPRRQLSKTLILLFQVYRGCSILQSTKKSICTLFSLAKLFLLLFFFFLSRLETKQIVWLKTKNVMRECFLQTKLKWASIWPTSEAWDLNESTYAENAIKNYQGTWSSKRFPSDRIISRIQSPSLLKIDCIFIFVLFSKPINLISLSKSKINDLTKWVALEWMVG